MKRLLFCLLLISCLFSYSGFSSPVLGACQDKVSGTVFFDDFGDNSCMGSEQNVAFLQNRVYPVGFGSAETSADAATMALMRFDDQITGSGQRVRNEVSGIDFGLTVGNITSVPGVFGNAFNFDGNSYVSIPNYFTNVERLRNNGLTLSAWVYPRDITNKRLIIGYSQSDYSNPGLYVSGGKLGFSLYYNDDSQQSKYVTSASSIAANAWHLVAVTYDPKNRGLRLYIDGKLEGNESGISNAGYSGGASSVSIGDNTGRAGARFDGYIDEVMVLDRPISDAEASDSYDPKSIVRGSFESQAISTGGSYNTLYAEISETNSGANVLVDAGSGWRRITNNSYLIYNTSNHPAFSSFMYKVNFSANTTLNSIRFRWANVDYASGSLAFMTTSDSPSGFVGHVDDAVEDAFSKYPLMDFMVSTGDFENFAPIDRNFNKAYFKRSSLPIDFAPWFTAIGNHNHENQERMEYIVRKMVPRLQGLPGMARFRVGPSPTLYGIEETGTTYSFDYKNVHFIFLDTYYGSQPGTNRFPLACVYDEIYNWLEQDLQLNTKPFIFVFSHEPAWPSTGGHDHCGDSLDDTACPNNYISWNDPARPARDRFWNLLKRYNVTASFAGHTHEIYARVVNNYSDFGLVAGVNGDQFCNPGVNNVVPNIANGIVITPGSGVLEFNNGVTSNGDYHVVKVNGSRATFDTYTNYQLSREFYYDIGESAAQVCGNGKKEGGEECDDGNTANYDGCSQECKIESGTIVVDNSLAADCSNYNSQSRSCGSGTEKAYTRISAAANIAQAGDNVLIRGGTYNEYIMPNNSGVQGSPITFRNFGNETAVIKGAYLHSELLGDRDGWYFGFYMRNRSYITITGLDFEGITHSWGRVLFSDNIVISGNRFRGAGATGIIGGIYFMSSRNNRIVNNVIDDGNDNIALINTNHTVIEGNNITLGRHVLWTIKCGNYNIIRNNYFNNQIQKIGEIYDCNDLGRGGDDDYFGILQDNSTKHNLVENNVFAFTAEIQDLDGDGDPDGPFNGIQYAGQNGIIRNNLFYDCQGTGIGMTLYPKEAMYDLYNRVYGNVFYNNTGGGIITGTSSDPSHSGGNIFKNNIFYRNKPIPIGWADDHMSGTQITHHDMANFRFESNNIINGVPGENDVIWVAYDHRISLQAAQSQYASLYVNNTEANPGFIDDGALYFHLGPASPMIDSGAYLTKTVGSGSGTSMTVEDAGYFFSGWGIPGEAGDMIQLQGQTERAGILDIDYAGRRLTLSRPLTWTAGQGVSIAYAGSGPDMGAFERGLVFDDTDQDGVLDQSDLCAATPKGTSVNMFGCPLPKAARFSIQTDVSDSKLSEINDLEISLNGVGRIKWLNRNITLMRLVSGRYEALDLDSNINMMNRRIELNPASLPMLNQPATITMYNVDLTQPKILKDGADCGSGCQIVSYSSSSRTLVFTVAHFTTYEAVNGSSGTPPPPEPPGPGPVGPGPSASCTTGEKKPCGLSAGRCKTGIHACINGQWGDCMDMVGPIGEICNGIDDDCNGVVDEGLQCECLIGQTRPCGLETGVCRPGYRMCTQGKWAEECNNEMRPAVEICGNKLDDDCDGQADEADCTLKASVNCSDGLIQQPCICQRRTYASGYCYNGYYFETKPVPDFPWEVLSLIGGGILSAFLLFIVVREVRHFRRIHIQIGPEEQKKVKLEVKPEKKGKKLYQVIDISNDPGMFLDGRIRVGGFIKLSNKVSECELWYSLYDQVATIALKSSKELKEGYAELDVSIRKTPLGYVYAIAFE